MRRRRRCRADRDEGFRPAGCRRIFGGEATAQRARVEKVDAWLSRARTGEGEQLAVKRVAVLGCGSLGAGVGKLLLQSGLRHAVLIDPETLGWENISRHELGADSVGQRKASELVARLRLMYPHVGELEGRAYDVAGAPPPRAGRPSGCRSHTIADRRLEFRGAR
jgi:hypothetical protein